MSTWKATPIYLTDVAGCGSNLRMGNQKIRPKGNRISQYTKAEFYGASIAVTAASLSDIKDVKQVQFQQVGGGLMGRSVSVATHPSGRKLIVNLVYLYIKMLTYGNLLRVNCVLKLSLSSRKTVTVVVPILFDFTVLYDDATDVLNDIKKEERQSQHVLSPASRLPYLRRELIGVQRLIKDIKSAMVKETGTWRKVKLRKALSEANEAKVKAQRLIKYYDAPFKLPF